jgi:hypothetical protein
MSLKPIRQTEQVNIDYICPWTQERGGCLSIVQASGMYFAEYSANPSGVFPMGIQLNDIEWMNLALQHHRTFSHPAATTDVPCGIVGICVQGDFITDWIYLVGDVYPGDDAYVGPSGTFTNSPAHGGEKIGSFRGVLQPDPHTVVYRGLGFSRQYVDPCDKVIKWENNPADRILIATPGYIKIRVDIGKQTRG